MAILKGSAAHISVPVVARFSSVDEDKFTVIVRRGNDQEFEQLCEMTKSTNPNKPSDRELLDKHIVELQGLTDVEGNLINGTGKLKWQPQAMQRVGDDCYSAETEEVISEMIGLHAYRAALIDSVYAGVGNSVLFTNGRLGNLQR